jgi:hypothetical protein
MFPRLEPRRGNVGSDVLGPQNPEKQRQNADLFCPPETDHGKMPNMKWSVLNVPNSLEI